MPENVPLALVVVGAVLLLIALLGGRFKLFGAEVQGTVGRASRWLSGFAGVALIAVAIYAGSGTTQRESTAPPPPQPSTAGTRPSRPPAAPSGQSAEPSPPPKPQEGPARAADPGEVFISTAVWPQSIDGRLHDARVREAVTIGLHGNDFARARQLLAEAGFPNGLVVVLPITRFAAAGGIDEDVRRIESRLAQIGVRIERRD